MTNNLVTALCIKIKCRKWCKRKQSEIISYININVLYYSFAPQIRHLLTLCTFINFIYLLTYLYWAFKGPRCQLVTFYHPRLTYFWHSVTLAISPERQSARMGRMSETRPGWHWTLSNVTIWHHCTLQRYTETLVSYFSSLCASEATFKQVMLYSCLSVRMCLFVSLHNKRMNEWIFVY